MLHLPPGGCRRREPVDGGPDPGLVLLALSALMRIDHRLLSFWPAAVSISVRTRLARS